MAVTMDFPFSVEEGVYVTRLRLIRRQQGPEMSRTSVSIHFYDTDVGSQMGKITARENDVHNFGT